MKRREDGALVIGTLDGYLNPEAVLDAEEWAQAKHDADLGRCRDPFEPHLVIYPDADGTGARVLDERDGTSIYAARAEAGSFELHGNVRGHFKAAWEYFEAHPERKPWHDARPEEVWLMGSGLHEFVALVGDDGKFRFADGSDMALTEEFLTGRRIWPEDAS